jgi:hypothetical protein
LKLRDQLIGLRAASANPNPPVHSQNASAMVKLDIERGIHGITDKSKIS